VGTAFRPRKTYRRRREDLSDVGDEAGQEEE
jgi:hypothetical protein